jgi:hypothetical protein
VEPWRIGIALALLVAVGGGCGPTVDGEDDDSTSCTTESCTATCNQSGFSGTYQCTHGVCICPSGEQDGGSPPGSDGGGGGTPGQSCDVDLLLVVDTSGSMFDAAKDLREVAFPSFATQLEQYTKLGSYRVAVKNHLFGTNPAGATNVDDSKFVTAGYESGYQCQNLVSGCDAEGHEYESLAGGYRYYLCDDVPETSHLASCSFASGASWMEGPSSTVLDEMKCVGRIPCHQAASLDEPTLRAGIEGLRYSGNAGFLREKALLVVVYLTDEDDASSGMTYPQMRQALLDLKGGDEKYVVVATLAGPKAGTQVINSVTGRKGCVSSVYGGIYETPKIEGFTSLFGERGRHYNLCADDISTALTDALDRLKMSCEEIIIY